MTNPPEVTLQRALVAVFPLYADRMVERFDVVVDAGPISEGQAWLAQELEALLRLPYAEQRRGPLEVFQEATGYINEALASAGAVPKPRDGLAEEALPGDVFGVAPVSTRELGRTVWEAHLRWGAAKAAALAGG